MIGDAIEGKRDLFEEENEKKKKKKESEVRGSNSKATLRVTDRDGDSLVPGVDSLLQSPLRLLMLFLACFLLPISSLFSFPFSLHSRATKL